MRLKIQALLSLIVLIICAFIALQIIENPSKARQQAQAPETRLRVNAQAIQTQNFIPMIKSYGVVKAKVSGSLISEVSGKLIYRSPKLVSGGQFQKGEKLAQIDPRQYQAELIIAEGNLANANFKLEEELALGQQAKTDWTRLGKAGEASPLALRKPHLVAVKAQLRAAEASLEQAKLNLEKTTIFAPYTGKVLSKFVDEGQYLSANTVVADIFASNQLEVRLPVSLLEYSFLNLPHYENSEGSVPIQLSSRLGTEVITWPAHIVSVENFLDPQSKQLHLIAEINEQELASNYKHIPLKIGQFVEAKIEGASLNQVFVIPRSALSQNEAVYLSKQERLVKQKVSVVWSDEKYAVIEGPLKDGDLLVVTPLGNPVTGTLLSVDIIESAINSRKAG
jgi:RND family efflux transporter MFP subunit